MYNPRSNKAEEFIDDGEILETLAYAEKNKRNAELIDQILEKAKLRKGLSHREAAVLLDCELESDEELDLSGWTVSNRGDVIGTVEHMELFPGNPCISVGGHLIPLHEDLITSLDDKKRKIDFNLPEGLLDD